MTRRIERINSLIMRLAASFFKKELFLDRSTFVTVTRVETSDDLKSAKIFISVFPEKKEKETARAIRGEIDHLKNYFASNLTMKFLPTFKIEIDEAEKARARFEELLKKSNN